MNQRQLIAQIKHLNFSQTLDPQCTFVGWISILEFYVVIMHHLHIIDTQRVYTKFDGSVVICIRKIAGHSAMMNDPRGGGVHGVS